jgi:hypothetical protein
VVLRDVQSTLTRIDVKHLGAGSYTVRLGSSGTVRTMPLIIAR